MSCDCENKKKSSEYGHIRELAKKAAMLEGSIMAIYRKENGTYTFSRASEYKGTIIELIHYL